MQRALSRDRPIGRGLSSERADSRRAGRPRTPGATPHRRRRPEPARHPRRAAARRRLRRGDRPRRRRGAAPARERLAGPAHHRHADAAHGRAHPRARDQGPRRPPDHRPVRHRHRRLQGGPPRRGGRGLRHQAVPLPGAAGADQARAPAAGRPGARPAVVLGPNLALELQRRAATVDGRGRLPHAHRVAPPLRARRQPGPDRHHRDPARLAAGPTPRTPIPRTSGSRCAASARRSSPTRTGRATCSRSAGSATAWRRTRRDPVPGPDHRGAAHRGAGAARRVRRAVRALRPGRSRRHPVPDPADRVRHRGAAGRGLAFVVAGSLTAPLRALATTLDRVAAGDRTRRSRSSRTTS